MSNPVVLDSVEHHDLRIAPGKPGEHGDNVNQSLVFATEFAQLQREYPIFFRKDGEGRLQAVALLGLDRDENLFLTEDGWNARYIPAVIARGPFLIGLRRNGEDQSQAEPMIQVDLDDPRISKTNGELLFKTHGGNSAYLDHVAGVLRKIHNGMALTERFFQALVELDLIEEVNVEISLSDTESYTLPDLFSISEDKWNALGAETLHKLHTTGLLPLCVAVLFSLSNVSRLADLKAQKRTL